MNQMKRSVLLIVLSMMVLVAQPSISVVAETGNNSYEVGDTVAVALRITIPESYHLYSNPLGPGIGKALTITPQESEHIEWISAVQQEPYKFVPESFDTDWTWVWDDSATIVVYGVLGFATPPEFDLSFSLSGLVCKDACIPVSATASTAISVQGSTGITPFESDTTVQEIMKIGIPFPLPGTEVVIPEPVVMASIDEPIQWDYLPQEKQVEFNLWIALFFAFLAGVILNFMPCVLPVLGIKILAFSEGRNESRSTAIKHSLAFAVGMISIFMILASLAAFYNKGWGEQFQDPRFIVGVVSLLFLFALGMFDLFTIFVPNKVAELDSKQDSSTLWGNFAKGAFATILATPCSGPFLGATLAWTLLQSKLVIYLVFLALGAGMASPYILLASSKRLSQLIPKPGAWMEDFKHLLGFFLLGFAVYLMIGLPLDMVLPTVALFVILVAAVMIYKRVAPFGSSVMRKGVATTLMLLTMWGGYHFSFTTLYNQISEDGATTAAKESAIEWQDFSVDALRLAESEGKSIMIDFTANWCMNCQLNKVNVYYSDEVEQLLLEKDIVTLKADLTGDNPVAESLRNHLGGRSVPFLAIFDSSSPSKPIIMRDVVSKKQVISVLKSL